MTSFRDQVMDALLARLRSKCGTNFRTYSRRFMTWEQMVQNITDARGSVPQPACFLYDGMGLGGGTDTTEQRGRGPSVITMNRSIVIYNRFPGGTVPVGADATTPGGTIFYPLVESIENDAMAADSAQLNTLTLGGLVSHCWIEGQTWFVTPDIDPSGQGMCVIPVSIRLLPRAV